MNNETFTYQMFSTAGGETKQCAAAGSLSARPRIQIPGADPGFLPGEGAKVMMTLYGMGMSDF